MEIPAEDLGSEKGMTILLAKLDGVFLKEEKCDCDCLTEKTVPCPCRTTLLTLSSDIIE